MTSTPMRGRLACAAAFAAVIATGFRLSTGPSAGQPYTATGQITCQSGQTPVGVWVSAPFGDAGWAVFTADPHRPDRAVYSRLIEHGGEYTVNVGCGGSPARWRMTATSAPHAAGWISLTCNDLYSPIGRLAAWAPPLDWTNWGGTAYARCD